MNSKRTAVITGWACILATAWVLATACGGGEDGDGTPRTTCRPAQAVVFGTPADLPEGLAEYQSSERGYLVRYPSDWGVEEVGTQNITGEAFISPEPGEQLKPNLSATCETVPIGTTSKEFLDSKLEVIEMLRGERPQITAELEVDGREAFAIEYIIVREGTPEPLRAEKIEVFFADELGGWTLALAAPEGMLETYRPIFDDFVASFQGQRGAEAAE
jgi:hypothetical protein